MGREEVMVNVACLTKPRATWGAGLSAFLKRIVFTILTYMKRPISIADWTIPWAVQMGKVGKHQSVSSDCSFLTAM